jgi:8-amino-7-oxononanoate synthase
LQETALRGLADRLVLLGTFGKALGGFGAYVAGPPEAVDYLVNFGRGFIFSTSLPPAVLGSNLGALEALEEEAEAWRPAQLQRISAYAREELQKRGLDLGSSQSHIAPVRLGSPERASLVSAFFFDHGIHAPAIRPPTVPPGTSRLRINFTAAFSEEDVTRLGDALEAALQSAQAAPRA